MKAIPTGRWLFLLLFCSGAASAQLRPVILPEATHVAGISHDTIFLVNGSTYAFTVDSPEDQGPVSTGADVPTLLAELPPQPGQQYTVTNADGTTKQSGMIVTGDRLLLTNGRKTAVFRLLPQPLALNARLTLLQPYLTAATQKDITLHFTAGQRSPDATVQFELPEQIVITPENTTVNIIGRGAVMLKDLASQSIGRTGTKYSYTHTGTFDIERHRLTLRHLDLRPANGPDVVLTIRNVTVPAPGSYHFKASYITAQPAVLHSETTAATLTATRHIADLERVVASGQPFHTISHDYTNMSFRWNAVADNKNVVLQQSPDSGITWQSCRAVITGNTAMVTGLQPDRLYAFRLAVKSGSNKGYSNTVYGFTGMMDIKRFGAAGKAGEDYTDAVNAAVLYLHRIGGGTLRFSEGSYGVRTVHLQSNVYLYVDKTATIKALPGADAPETTWFSDKRYRSGLSPTDTGPYADPENYLTKQDVGHHYFRNAMFFGERLDNVKIIGNGRITGDGHLATSDKVMNNTPDKRADKMFVLKCCTNLEIGGIYRPEDLWYDEATDEPYYTDNGGTKITDQGNMLHIDQAGHFVLLATGTDSIYVHNTYFGKYSQRNARDIFDFMACNHVTATNIYSRVSSDDIIKPGSDCSLGFTRPARHYRVRNIIGDTNCNLFQIGSETADDITDICVDNIWVLGANKAGFSISTNDGGHIKDIHLNCGHTGRIHARSRMYRTAAPFFLSISNRARVLGAVTGKYTFTENGRQREELLVKNVNIGSMENILINGIDITAVYSGSSYNGQRWKPYDGSQKRATSIIAGYALPDTDSVSGGLDFRLPDGRHTGYIENVSFTDVHITDKGGNPLSDTACTPPELGVGQYNVANLKVQPAYGLWARHVTGLTVKESSFRYEKRDSRYALFLEDVKGAVLSGISAVRAADAGHVIKVKRSSGISISSLLYFEDEWNQHPREAPEIKYAGDAATAAFPRK
ncbi:endopygalactorunase [Chitinophaga sp. Mgbs1]|uniref:Endopygalactorunase n=1 Tax=Chitinophaga solisilvae TaxID=1233460 RepID=A0A433WKW2_9BACT|nr:endopygalactorunase [Chitinophaga solisilvae]